MTDASVPDPTTTTAAVAAAEGPPVVIVGGGVSGLACAIHLHGAGVPVLVLEASDRVGGRVRTDAVEGFRLDRGFQVYLDAYPEGARMLDLAGLDLHPFMAGADLRVGGRTRRLLDPSRHPSSLLTSLGTALSPKVYGFRAAMRTLGLKIMLRRHFSGRGGTPSLERPSFRPDAPTAEDFLRQLNFGDRAIERFWRPFLAGILLDRSLESATASMFMFLFSMFDTGSATLPAGGMEAIPRQLASRLPKDAIRVHARVAQAAPDHVLLEGGERLDARAVVVATDRTSARDLHAADDAPGWNGTACLWYAAEKTPVDDPILVLNAEDEGTPVGDGPIRHLCVHSRVAPGYAPAGAELVCLNTVGVPNETDDALAEAAESQMRAWFGDQVTTWRHLRTDRIPHALPRIVHPEPVHESERYRTESGVFRAGDDLENASINGALLSGRVAARCVIDARS